MARQRAAQPTYMVNCCNDPNAKGAIRFTFVPNHIRRVGAEGEPPQSVPQYIRWNVDYNVKAEPTVGNNREAEAKPLTKAMLRKVFDETKAHAG